MREGGKPKVEGRRALAGVLLTSVLMHEVELGMACMQAVIHAVVVRWYLGATIGRGCSIYTFNIARNKVSGFGTRELNRVTVQT